MTELATIQPAQLTQVQPSFADLERAAKYAAESGVFGPLTVAQAMTMFLTAQAEGIHPMRALKIYDVIKGKAALKPAIMLARYQAAGGRIRYIERSNTRCEIEFTHPAADSLTVTWTIEDARRIGLAGKDNWRNYPGPMLQWRCVAEGIRATCPGVLDGMYSSDEVQDFDTEPFGYAETPMKFVQSDGGVSNTNSPNYLPPAKRAAKQAEFASSGPNVPPAGPVDCDLPPIDADFDDLPAGTQHVSQVLAALPEGIDSAQVVGGNQFVVGKPDSSKGGVKFVVESARGQEELFYYNLANAQERSGLDAPWQHRGTITFHRVKEKSAGKWDVDQLHFPELEANNE